MFAMHQRPRQNQHQDGWDIADRATAALAVVAVMLAAAWAGMTF